MSETTSKFSSKVRERAIRRVLDHEQETPWAVISSIATNIGCTAQTFNEWVKEAEVDADKDAGVPTEMAERVRALEREVHELRQANEILQKLSVCFAQSELDRPLRK